MIAGLPHTYLSNACRHDDCDRCDLVCYYCANTCACVCHAR